MVAMVVLVERYGDSSVNGGGIVVAMVVVVGVW